MRTETRPVVEPTVVPSDTNLEDPTSAMPDSSEPKPAPETDETPDEESPDMETDDLDTKKHLFLSHLPFCSLSLRRSCLNTKEFAVVHERSVRPRIELPAEDELFVSSQLQSFREQVQEHVNDHGVEGIGAHTVFAIASS